MHKTVWLSQLSRFRWSFSEDDFFLDFTVSTRMISITKCPWKAFYKWLCFKNTCLAAMQVEEKCQDNPYFANCKLIVKARWGPKPSHFFTGIVFGGLVLYCVWWSAIVLCIWSGIVGTSTTPGSAAAHVPWQVKTTNYSHLNFIIHPFFQANCRTQRDIFVHIC